MNDLDSIPGEPGECRDGLKLVEQALERQTCDLAELDSRDVFYPWRD